MNGRQIIAAMQKRIEDVELDNKDLKQKLVEAQAKIDAAQAQLAAIAAQKAPA